MFENGVWTEETTLPTESAAEETTEATVEQPTEPEEENTTEPDAKPAEEEPKYTVKYNGKEIELPVSELIKNAQKGMNYDHVRGELEELRKTKAQLEAEAKAKEQLRSVLKLYGYDGTDEEVVTMLAAQAQQITPEEYRQRQLAEQERINQLLEQDPRYQEWKRAERLRTAQLMEIQDLQAIKAQFPEVTVDKVDDLPNYEQFMAHRFIVGPDGQLIEKMSAVEAYALANVLGKPKNKPNPEDKDHLRAKGGSAGVDDLVDIPKNELEMWRNTFPKDSYEKLKKRYNDALKRGEQ